MNLSGFRVCGQPLEKYVPECQRIMQSSENFFRRFLTDPQGGKNIS
jgi:hypothetical protein